MENRPFGQASPPLNYQAPIPGRPIFSIGAFIGALVFSGGVTISMMIAPKFEPIFRDFHTDLPAVTQWLLILSRFFWNDFGWLLLIPLIVAVPFVHAAVFPPPANPSERKLRGGWLAFTVTVLTFIWVVFVAIALFAPMVSLIETVSAPPKK